MSKSKRELRNQELRKAVDGALELRPEGDSDWGPWLKLTMLRALLSGGGDVSPDHVEADVASAELCVERNPGRFPAGLPEALRGVRRVASLGREVRS